MSMFLVKTNLGVASTFSFKWNKGVLGFIVGLSRGLCLPTCEVHRGWLCYVQVSRVFCTGEPCIPVQVSRVFCTGELCVPYR